MFDLNKHEMRFVEAIISRCKQLGYNTEFPNNNISKMLGVEKTRFSNLKRSLVNKGILVKQNRGGCKLTSEALQLFSLEQDNKAVNAEFPLLGEVKAGRTKQDDLRVYLPDLSSLDMQTAETRSIPSKISDPDIFLLEVVGDSMVHIGIQEGDYLLVKPFPKDTQPQQGQLIVTKYLLPADAIAMEESKDFSPDLLEGPTVKYYNYLIGNKFPHRLTSHLKIEESTFNVHAASIFAIGFVVGSYKNFSR